MRVRKQSAAASFAIPHVTLPHVAGALLKLAGVSYTWGRESNATFNESAAGRLPGPAVADWPYGVRAAQLPRGISPWVDASNTTLLPGVWGGSRAAAGDGDDRVGSYDWRLTLTNNTDNMVPIPPPERYDPAEFELIRRALKVRSSLADLPHACHACQLPAPPVPRPQEPRPILRPGSRASPSSLITNYRAWCQT